MISYLFFFKFSSYCVCKNIDVINKIQRITGWIENEEDEHWNAECEIYYYVNRVCRAREMCAFVYISIQLSSDSSLSSVA